MSDGLYLRDKCSQCGTCLAGCPSLAPISTEAAAGFMRRLAAGEWLGEVLERCTGCMSCDAACPNGAHPYGLLLERFGERYLATGIPRVFCNAMPQRDGPNIWRGLERWLSKREKENLEFWARPPEPTGTSRKGRPGTTSASGCACRTRARPTRT